MALGGCVVWARRSAKGWSDCSEGAGRAFHTRWELKRRPHGFREQQLLKGGFGLPASVLAQPFKIVSRRTDLALSRPESRVRARGVGTARVLPKVC